MKVFMSGKKQPRFPHKFSSEVLPMRWGSDGNGGVGASAYTRACRDENASYYYYQEPAVPSPSSAFRPGQARGNVHIKKPPDKRQARQFTGNHAARPRCELKDVSGITGDITADRPEEASGEPEATGRPPLIVCAGRSVYGPKSDVGGFHGHTNQHSIESLGQTQEHWVSSESNDDNVKYTNRRPVSAARLKRAGEPSSPSRSRTDEELEQIIRDLRDQVFHNQQRQELVRLEKSPPSTNQGKTTQKHQRKHLKNPVEKMMEGAAAQVPVGASFSAGNGPILQRPLSSCYLGRLVTESTIQMVVPAIINEAPPATSRGGSRASCNHAVERDFRSLSTATPRSRPSSSSSYHPEERPSTEAAVVNPRHSRSKKLSGKSHSRREMQQERTQLREDRHESLSYSDSFLYLVDVDDSEKDPASLSLSPVGPWVVDEFTTARGASSTSSPRSPSVSTCYSLSNFGSDDFDCGEGESRYSELAALSPRSRLLYFSACAHDGEVARSTFPQLHHGTLRRSATCGSGLVTSTKLEARAARPKRCSSAKARRSRSRPASSASGSRQKAATRVNQTRKRPQSGEAAGSDRTTNTS